MASASVSLLCLPIHTSAAENNSVCSSTLKEMLQKKNYVEQRHLWLERYSSQNRSFCFVAYKGRIKNKNLSRAAPLLGSVVVN